MGVEEDGYTGQADPMAKTHPYNSLVFAISQVIAGKWTITLAQVKSVSGGSTAGPATVSVQPMVNLIDGKGNPTPHETISNIPAFRLQGGNSGFIIDPVAGDIGILACASSDISAVKANKAPSNPGSFRTFDPADGLFIGGFLGAALQQFVQITAQGVVIGFSNFNITLGQQGAVFNCPVAFPQGASGVAGGGGTINLGNANMTTTGTQTMANATIGGRNFNSHTHSSVQPGSGTSGPPV